MLVRYKSGKVYGYFGCSRQRAVALAYRRKIWNLSIGAYLNHIIKGHFAVVQLDDVQ